MVERNRNNDEHQHFGAVLNGLEEDHFTLNKGQPIAMDIITVGQMKRIGIGCGEWGSLGQPLQHKLSVGVLVVCCKSQLRGEGTGRAEETVLTNERVINSVGEVAASMKVKRWISMRWSTK
jgi:hypothetical protein